MTRTEIEKTRKQIKSNIAILIAKLNDDSKRFYGTFAKNLSSVSIGMLIYEWIGVLNEYTEDTYISLQENYSILTDLQRLHQQLLQLDVLEQGLKVYEQI